ncbi:28S ribosomal protein S34, mitochondrial [Anthonomus grandis grandis]|uniref:28S ribosomal protein S34, mitochondrial n=1 Tax=Anthonomus grandis grandis TaxID=2921223 RepID=UPI00216610A4|nr:28S ribosomal protein S34, mitochondrial [Anthonomus grandis grandis]
MPYKYIGRTHDFKGKTLWEIVGNLKNYGVGRVIARNRMQRYEEPSYMKILSVETLPKPEDESPDNVRKVRVLVEKTFRGVTAPKPILMESVTYKADYVLIPKHEEEAFCKPTKQSTNSTKIFPRTMEFPPLMKELLLREKKSGESGKNNIDLELNIKYNPMSRYTKYRVAKEGEEPNVKFTMGIGTPVAPRLYKGTGIV